MAPGLSEPDEREESEDYLLAGSGGWQRNSIEVRERK